MHITLNLASVPPTRQVELLEVLADKLDLGRKVSGERGGERG
jgi:hypothetical protein